MRSPHCFIGWHSPILRYTHKYIGSGEYRVTATCLRCGKPQPTPKGNQ